MTLAAILILSLISFSEGGPCLSSLRGKRTSLSHSSSLRRVHSPGRGPSRAQSGSQGWDEAQAHSDNTQLERRISGYIHQERPERQIIPRDELSDLSSDDEDMIRFQQEASERREAMNKIHERVREIAQKVKDLDYNTEQELETAIISLFRENVVNRHVKVDLALKTAMETSEKAFEAINKIHKDIAQKKNLDDYTKKVLEAELIYSFTYNLGQGEEVHSALDKAKEASVNRDDRATN